MAKVMVTLRLDPGAGVARPGRAELLGLAPEEVDPGFGVVNISPAEHLYTILVDQDRPPTRIADAPQVEGVFSNPRIEPFGPPEGDQGTADRAGITLAARRWGPFWEGSPTPGTRMRGAVHRPAGG